MTSKHFGFPAAQRTSGSLTALSGGHHMSYIEKNKSANKAIGRPGPSATPRQPAFAKQANESKNLQKAQAVNVSRG